MEIFIGDTYQHMSAQAVNDILSLTRGITNPVLCTASGDTPAGLYKALVEEINEKKMSVNGWYFLSLDEWAGMNGDDEGSCRFHLNNQLFNQLAVAKENICFFDGKEKNLSKECDRIEHFISGHGGITIAILGLGMNGHIGMNEPGTSSLLHTHVADIDSETQKVGQKYFKVPQQLSKGITLGLATLMQAHHIILLVSGRHKSGVVKKFIEGNISEELPASLLKNHPNVKVYLDKEAAALL